MSIRINNVLLLIACFTAFGYSCKKKVIKPTPYGEWVENTHHKDTIAFGDENMFNLKREFLLQNTHVTPKIGAGLYFYSINRDSIQLYYTISSSSVKKNYYFKIEETKLYVGDFFDAPSSGSVRVFERIK